MRRNSIVPPVWQRSRVRIEEKTSDRRRSATSPAERP
jgi:hypothetical protein